MRNGMSEDRIVAQQDGLSRLRIRTTQSEIKILAKRRNTESLGQIVRDKESGRPNRKSISSQKDKTSNHWDRSSWMTNQDDPIGNQNPRKKTEHRMTGIDPPGRQIRTIKELSNTQSIGHRNMKKHLRLAGLSSPHRKEQERPPRISHFKRKIRTVYI